MGSVDLIFEKERSYTNKACLIQAYSCGITGHLIAEKFGISVATISLWNKKHGINSAYYLNRYKFKITHGMLPEDLEKWLNDNKVSLSAYCKSKGFSRDAVGHQFKRFKIKPYRVAKAELIIVNCQLCHKLFSIKPWKVKAGRGKYCSPECSKRAKRTLPHNTFHINSPSLILPSSSLGDYTDIHIGSRQRQFVNKDKVDHFFFDKGITNESQAYFLGVMETDGSIRYANNMYRVRLQMIDGDIVNLLANIVKFKNVISYSEHRGTYSWDINSPYLYHDLESLGCVANKTSILHYPVINCNLERHFIRGTIDGDGSWRFIDGVLRLKFCGHDEFVWGFTDAIKRHLKLEPHSVYYPVNRKMKSFCEIEYNTTDSLLIRDWIYEGATIFGERKRVAAYSHPLTYLQRFGTNALADIIGVGIDVVKRLQRSRNLSCHKIGPYRYFLKSDLIAWYDFLRGNRPKLENGIENLRMLIASLDGKEAANLFVCRNKL